MRHSLGRFGLLVVCIVIGLTWMGVACAQSESIELGEKERFTFTQSDAVVDITFTTTEEPAFYNIEVRNINIETYGRYADDTLNATVYDDDDVNLGSVYVQKESTETLSYKLRTDARYTLRMNLGDGVVRKEGTGDYQITITVSPDPEGETPEAAREIGRDEKGTYTMAGYQDLDYLTFTTSDTPSYYNIDIKNVDIETTGRYHNNCLIVGVYSEDMEEAGIVGIQMGQTERISAKLAPSTTYYLRAMQGDDVLWNMGSYEVTINTIEDLPGETPQEAVAIALDEKVAGAMNGFGDVDYFSFTAKDVPTFYNIDVKNIDIETTGRYGNDQLMVALYDSENEEIGWIGMEQGATSRLSYRLEEGATYYLKARQGDNITQNLGAYELTVSTVDDPAGEAPADALAIALDEKISGAMDGFLDVDYLAFTTSPAPAFYNIAVKNVDIETTGRYGNDQLMAALYDGENEELGWIGMEQGATNTMSFKLEPDTVYYLKLRQGDNITENLGMYEVMIHETPDTVGDIRDDAQALALGETTVSTLDGQGDVDYFSFTTNVDRAFYNIDAKNADVETVGSYGNDRVMFSLENAEGEEIVWVGAAMGETEHISEKLAPNETYFVKVRQGENIVTNTGAYELTVHIVADDIGDTPEEAQAAAAGEKAAGQIEGKGDIDWFTFRIEGESEICGVEIADIDVAGTDSYGCNVVATIYDAAQNEVRDIWAGLGEAAHTTFVPKADSEYFVKVEVYGGEAQNVGGYEIRICADGKHFPASEWAEWRPANCAEEGKRTLTCTLCGGVAEEEVLAPLGHKPGEWEIVLEATCTEAGEQRKYCTVCYEMLESEVLPALGHDFGEWVITKEATKNEEGEQERTCSRCGEVEKQAIEKLPKNFFERLFGL